MAEEDKYKKRMISCFRFPEEGLSLSEWGKIRNPVRVLRNFIIITACKYMPDIRLKNRLYRKAGIKIGRNVRIYGTNFDIFFPEMIEIGDNCTIGSFTTIVTHEFHHNQYKKGRVKIGSNVLVGSLTMILAGVEIGDDAKIAAYSLVNRSVPPGALVGGVPIKDIGKA
ncbi:MAG: acyltransferase [Candidatus Aenigmarchaeota archaeon]|nr:acyltransferase [Candidatus Aenigmarchaeota archaeon]